MLLLTNVRKYYFTKLILKIPSFQLESGVYWIKGANGSGKTTLLKIVAGLLPFEGDVIYDRISLKKNPLAYRRKISWAEAEPVYPGFLTGLDLLSLYKDIRKASSGEVNQLCDLFNISSFANQNISTYSAGMVKKLSLVLAFIGNPELIILDEPLITLDNEVLGVLADYIVQMYKTKGTTFLLSSHQELSRNLAFIDKELQIENQTLTTLNVQPIQIIV